MKIDVLLGLQWGDEGKGKVVDVLTPKYDVVARFQGGPNAGHTLEFNGEKYVLRSIPSGIFQGDKINVIGNGVVLDPALFKGEIEGLEKSGHNLKERLYISKKAHLILPTHRLLDAAYESAKGDSKIGTTGKGIGPAYEDKTSRKGLKLKDLLDKKVLEQKLRDNMIEKEVLFTHLYKVDYPSIEQEVEELFELGKLVAPYLTDTFSLIDKAVAANKKILFEGAQGVLLDIDYGTYPFVTSSSTSAAGIYSGAGLPGKYVEEVLGITKAYTTRVGEGPFPTEMFCDLGDKIQTIGHEFGATTGRKRRCGWIDLPLLKYSVKASSITSIALTKVDVLSGLEELKVCVGYRYNGEEIDCAYPGIDLTKVEPILKDMKPFHDDFKTDEFSSELKDYLHVIEEAIGAKVGILAYGPERSEIKFLKNYF